MDTFAYWLGGAVMVLGGLGAVAVAAWWAVDRIARFWTNSAALIRIMMYARREGLNLATGEKCEPEIPA